MQSGACRRPAPGLDPPAGLLNDGILAALAGEKGVEQEGGHRLFRSGVNRNHNHKPMLNAAKARKGNNAAPTTPVAGAPLAAGNRMSSTNRARAGTYRNAHISRLCTATNAPSK